MNELFRNIQFQINGEEVNPEIDSRIGNYGEQGEEACACRSTRLRVRFGWLPKSKTNIK